MIKTDDKQFKTPLDKLLWVMQCLRDKQHGCPWDIEQDFKSILPYTLEEAYEVADAIERGNMDDLKEELGDLLLQVVYHAQMATEQNSFDFDGVANDIADKMISRHPHVFGDKEASNAEDVDKIWDAQKENEKSGAPILSTVTKGLPALLRAQKLQKKAAKTGFEWPDAQTAYKKVEEELVEFHDATTHEQREEEFGDILIALTNYGRMNGINAEEALRKANNKFEKRFTGVEEHFKTLNKDMKEATLDEMLEAWTAQKAKQT